MRRLLFLILLSVGMPCGALGAYSDSCHGVLTGDGGAPGEARERLLLGYCHAREGEPSEAALHLEGLESHFPGLSAHIHYYRGLALSRMGQWEGAAAPLEKVLEGDPSRGLRERAYSLLADSYSRTGNHAKAHKYFTALAEVAADPGVEAPALFRSAESLVAIGSLAKALKTFESLWLEHPESEISPLALQRARSLGETLSMPFTPSSADHRKRADRLYSLRLWRAALVSYRSAEKTEGVRVNMAVCMYHTREYEKALRGLRGLGGPRASWWRAKTFLRKGMDGAAIEQFSAIHKRFPRNSIAADALMKAARLLQVDGSMAEARELYMLFLRKYPHHEWTPEAHWQMGWMEYRRGSYAEAARLFSRAGTGKGKYWLARTLEKTGREARSRKLLARLAAENEPTYYGYLARLKTGVRPAYAPPGGASVGLRYKATGGLKKHKRALLLASLGMYEDARAEALDLRREAGRGRGRLEAGSVLCKARDYYSAIRAAVGLDGAAALVLAYPRGRSDLVSGYTERYGVDELMVYSIMREESRFQPGVVSSAGAIGYMQIMPATGAQTAKKLGISPYSTGMLYTPATNIHIGTAYYGKVLGEFGDNPTHALASYNGGPHNVSRWKRRNGHLDDDEFTEEIPFVETRNYVKKVLGSYGAYRAIYDGTSAPECP